MRLPNIDDKSKDCCSNCKQWPTGLEILRRSVVEGSLKVHQSALGTYQQTLLVNSVGCTFLNDKLSNFRVSTFDFRQSFYVLTIFILENGATRIRAL